MHDGCMRRLLRCVLWLALLAHIAAWSTSSYAGTASLTLQAPTTNLDGSPVVQPLTYRASYGCGLEVGFPNQTQTWSGVSFVVPGLPDVGTCRFVAFAIDGLGRVSGASNVATKVMGPGLGAPGKSAVLVTWAPSPASPPMAIAKTYAGSYGLSGGTPATSGTSGSFNSTGYTHILVSVKHEGAAATITPSDNKSTTNWTSHTKETVAAASSDLHGQYFSAPIGSPGTGHTVTITFSAARPYCAFNIWLIDADSGTMELVAEANAEGSGTALDGGTLSNAGGASIVSFMTMLEYSATTHTGASGWTEDFDLSGAQPSLGGVSDNRTAGYSRGPETTTSIDPSGTQADSAAWGVISLSFKETTGGTTFNQSASGTVTLAGALVRQAQLVRAGTVTSSGTLVRTAAKVLAGTVTIAGALAALRTALLALAGSLSIAGALTRQPQKVLVGTVTSAGTLARVTSKLLAGSVSIAGALAAIRTLLLAIAGTVGISGALARRPDKSLAGTITSAGSLSRSVGKVLAGTVASSGALAAIRTVLVALTGAVAISGTLVRSTSKVLTGAVTIAGAVTRRVAMFLSGVVGLSGALVRTSDVPQPTTDLEASSRDVLANEAGSRDILDLGTDD